MLTHSAVKQEVDSVVDQCNNIHDVTEQNVDVKEEAIDDSTDDNEDSLRQFRNQKQYNDG